MQERYKTCASSDVANMQLTKIRCSSYHSVVEYCDQFENIARDSSFDDEAKIYFFTLGLPSRIQERIKMIHKRIERLSELVTTVAGNLEVEQRIYGTDPMEIDGRRPTPFNRSLGTSRYSNIYVLETRRNVMILSICHLNNTKLLLNQIFCHILLLL